MVSPSIVSTYVVTAAAMITASAAVAGAAYLRSIKGLVDEAHERSERNRRYLTGDDAPHPGAMERLRDVEERTARIVRSIDADVEDSDA
jgi:hypothetical protein